jgi:hypothetical protein
MKWDFNAGGSTVGLAGHAAMRAAIIPKNPARRPNRSGSKLIRMENASDSSRWHPWADLLNRVFSIDIFQCPRCMGRMHLRAIVVGPPATTKILDGLARAEARCLGEVA